uniref:Uncharacterized protein n=1 Tax=Acanthochromis polyacanthus TaxID=80966 RepID=A0A3Q1H8U6_9TELE
MEAIISAADLPSSLTNVSLISSGLISELTRPAAYIGTMTGCFFCPVNRLTMLRVSMPRQQSRALLQCEPPHWYRRPRASWMSCSCIHTLPRPPDLQQPIRCSHTVAATHDADRPITELQRSSTQTLQLHDWTFLSHWI